MTQGDVRKPNTVLRNYRRGLHLTQAEFADQVRDKAAELGINLACDEKRIGRWERGEVTWPSPVYRRVLIALTGKQPHELGFIPPPDLSADTDPAGGPAPELSRYGEYLDDIDAPAHPQIGSLDLDLPLGPTGSLVLVVDPRRHTLLDRREMMFGSATVLLVPGSAGIEKVFGGTHTDWRPARVTAAHVTALRDAEGFFRILDSSLGGGYARSLLTQFLRDRVAPLLRSDLGDDVRAPVLAGAAALVHRAGWMAYDMGQHEVAHRNYQKAYQLARAAGDEVRSAVILNSQAHGAITQRNGERVVELTSQALQHAQLAAVYARQARGYAILGQRKECLEALRRAEELLPDSDLIDESGLAAEKAYCLNDLGDTAEALRQATRSIEMSRPGATRSAALKKITVAGIHAERGDLEHACELGSQAVTMLQGVSSQRAVGQVRAFAKRLDRSDAACVRTFREQARELLSA